MSSWVSWDIDSLFSCHLTSPSTSLLTYPRGNPCLHSLLIPLSLKLQGNSLEEWILRYEDQANSWLKIILSALIQYQLSIAIIPRYIKSLRIILEEILQKLSLISNFDQSFLVFQIYSRMILNECNLKISHNGLFIHIHPGSLEVERLFHCDSKIVTLWDLAWNNCDQKVTQIWCHVLYNPSCRYGKTLLGCDCGFRKSECRWSIM